MNLEIHTNKKDKWCSCGECLVHTTSNGRGKKCVVNKIEVLVHPKKECKIEPHIAAIHIIQHETMHAVLQTEVSTDAAICWDFLEIEQHLAICEC